MTTHYGIPIWVAMILALAMALAFGFLNGFMVMRTGLPSFIVTLGTFFVLQGIDLALVKVITGTVAIQGMTLVPQYSQPHAIFGSAATVLGGSVYASDLLVDRGDGRGDVRAAADPVRQLDLRRRWSDNSRRRQRRRAGRAAPRSRCS